jgi:DNA-binding MarR family transcriptional regulator
MDLRVPSKTPDQNQTDRLLDLVHWSSAASRQLRRCLGLLAQGASLTDCELLTIWLCLQSEAGLVQGELAAAIGVSPAQMSGIAERLRQRGLIEMHRQTLDRRRQVWRGTPAARQVLDNLRTPLASLAAGVNSALPSADQQAAREHCERMASGLEAWPDQGIESGNVTNRPNDGSPRKAA